MTSDEAVNNDKNYNGNVRSNWQTAVICYLTFYACVFQFKDDLTGVWARISSLLGPKSPSSNALRLIRPNRAIDI